MNGPLGIVVSYSSIDRKFIDTVLREALKVTSKVVLSVGSHLHDMKTSEDMTDVESIARRFPQVKVVVYDVTDEGYAFNTLTQRRHAFWHNIARYAGFSELSQETRWVLFLDADEVLDGDRFYDWYTSTPLKQDTGYTLANYWYFREPIYQATTLEDSAILVPYSSVTYSHVMVDNERHGLLASAMNNIVRFVYDTHPSSTPMVHHYSWARSKEEMMRKVDVWGHKGDRNWQQLIEDEFSHEFNGTDFVHGYNYNIVEDRLSQR